MITIDTVKSVGEAIKCNKLLTKLIHSESKYNENINKDYIIENWFENLYDNEYNKIFVAKDSENIVGYAYCKITWVENGPAKELEAVLDGIYVEESYRNQGIATKLLNVAKEWAINKNVKYLTINVLEKNEVALKLYYKSGFNDFEKCLRATFSTQNHIQ